MVRIEHHHAIVLRAKIIDRLAILQQRQHLSLAAQSVLAGERAGAIDCELLDFYHGKARGLAGPFTLLLHGHVEGGHVDPQPESRARRPR